MANLVTLTTDFGRSNHYVAQMKGVILSRAPQTTIVDVTHAIPPQAIREGAFVLAESLSWFKTDSVHIVVVDPGVGSNRKILAARIKDQFVVAPDNGLITFAASRYRLEQCHQVTNRQLQLPSTSATFHGRDIMAPVASALSSGSPLEKVGPPLDDWARIDPELCTIDHQSAATEILAIDSFGNLITAISGDRFDAGQGEQAMQSIWQIRFPSRDAPDNSETIPIDSFVNCYADAQPGELVLLIGSHGYLEVAEVNGNAAQRLRCDTGDSLQIEWQNRDC